MTVYNVRRHENANKSLRNESNETEERCAVCREDAQYKRDNSMFLLQPPAASVDFPVAHGMVRAAQQRQFLGQAIPLTIRAVQVTPCLGRRSGCVWILASGRDANPYAVSGANMTV